MIIAISIVINDDNSYFFKYLGCVDNILSTVHVLTLHSSSKQLVL